MPRYNISVPATAAIYMTIEADSEEEAKEKIWNVAFRIKMESDDPASPEIGEFELHECVTEGNVFNGVLNDIEIEAEEE
jgi:hypothetical protein